jgi:hypothetical protein
MPDRLQEPPQLEDDSVADHTDTQSASDDESADSEDCFDSYEEGTQTGLTQEQVGRPG